MKDIIGKIDTILTEKGEKWSGNVKSKWEPSEGLFTKKASVIAKELIAQSIDLKTAISRISFYENRAGSNLSAERKAELEKAKDLIRKAFK